MGVYSPQTWFDDEAGDTPTSADRFNTMEQGILQASVDAANASIGAIPIYADVPARNSALALSLHDGLITYQQDTDTFTAFANGTWYQVLVGGSAWTTYTPVWTGAACSIGNGKLLGRFSKLGRTVNLNIVMVCGPSTTYGTNVGWSFSLPFAALDLANYGRFVGSAYARNYSPSQSYIGTCTIDDASGRLYPYTAAAYPAAAMIMSSSIPMLWANGDCLSMSVTYESTV
jgi:hypothetical protein